jgi:sialate O-acetylesterase
MKKHFGILCFCLAATTALADIKLPAIFSDHMVLQRDAPVTEAGQDGKWRVSLAPLKAGQPLTLTVTGKNKVVVQDVLAGEVWLCSGQSNMAFRVSSANNFEQEQAAANIPEIRMFTVGAAYGKSPEQDCKGRWEVSSPETVGQFSATAYFFGRELHKALGVPVGLINSSVGGTAIELWASVEAQRSSPELKPLFALTDKANAEFDREAAAARYEKAKAKWKEAAAKAKAAGEPVPRAPQDPVALHDRKSAVGPLFNGMIAPLVPYRIRGALWYQGEANSLPEKARFYQYQLPVLIQDWRARWGEGNFPFAWVQLPNFKSPQRNFPMVREGMLKSLRVPKTGMAVAIDIGDPDNIHPKNKQEVGRRLAMWARGAVYGQKVATSGPLPAGCKFAGGEATVSFTHTDGGLVAKGGELQGFTIADAGKNWVKAQARIAGDKVIVSSPDVKSPVAVRYAWADNPECNLYNGAGLPASPFRTDDWPE